MKNKIEITGSNLVDVVKAAYDLSSPQGLGVIHFEEGGLTDEEAQSLIDVTSSIPVRMDYVKGRACKFTVWKDEDGKLFIRDQWFDHSEADLLKLVDMVAV